MHCMQPFSPCMKYFKMAVAIEHQHHEFKQLVRPPRCKRQSYSHFDHTMLDFAKTNTSPSFKRAFELTNLQRSLSTPCLSNAGEDSDANPRIELVSGHGAPKVRALVVEVAMAMASGFNIEPLSSGLGGAYFIHARNGETIALVKPIDEEPLALNNPKGFAGRMLSQPCMKRSIRVGETGIRELAAYLLDHDSFAGVPPTALVKISHVPFHVNNSESVLFPPPYKIASLQRFVSHDSDAGDLGPSGFSVTSVHRIGILDVRILNLDRHSGNMLVNHGQEGYAVGAAEMVPIDHGLCLPESLDDPYFEWLHWPQASIPFSEPEVEYISNLDPFNDAKILRTRIPSIRESSLRVLMICTIFLKRATDAGLCLGDIGEMMTREFCGGEENLSVLENLCVTAKASLRITKSSDVFDFGFDSDSDDEAKEDFEMFQFDNEREDGSNGQVCNIPQLLVTPPGIGKPPRIPRYSSEKLISRLHDSIYLMNEDEFHDNKSNDYNSNEALDENTSGTDNDQNVEGLLRSMSYPVGNLNHDSGGISFGEMNEEEWKLLLEKFEELLPEAFEGRKNMGLSKLRLGTSCEFFQIAALWKNNIFVYTRLGVDPFFFSVTLWCLPVALPRPKMAEVKTDETLVATCSIPVKKSDSDEDPPISTTKPAGETATKNEPETFRETKRRKNCPSALENFKFSNSSFSFTFDTNSQSTLQFTPKFGSFKLAEPAAEIDIPATEKKEDEEEKAEESIRNSD